MLHSLLWFLAGLVYQPQPAEEIASLAGATCTYGCVVYADDVVYEITRQDVTTIALLAKAESGPRFVHDESAATVWAMVSRFAELNARRSRAERMSLTDLMRSYSAVLASTWRSGGKRYHPRITPRADAYADLGWEDLPSIWRMFAVEFIEGQVSNRMPGIVHVLARGFEENADEDLIGPYYASTEEQHPGGNAYYATADTRWWSPWEVRVVPAVARLAVTVYPARTSGLRSRSAKPDDEGAAPADQE
jgi:hypothetical protein